MATSRIKSLSLARYVSAALEAAEYERDEGDVVIGNVPSVSGFFAQGETYEEARSNLRAFFGLRSSRAMCWWRCS